jgi:hypothetical protein
VSMRGICASTSGRLGSEDDARVTPGTRVGWHGCRKWTGELDKSRKGWTGRQERKLVISTLDLGSDSLPFWVLQEKVDHSLDAVGVGVHHGRC